MKVFLSFFKDFFVLIRNIARNRLYLYHTNKVITSTKLKTMKYTIVQITDKNNPKDTERGQVHQATDLRFARDNGSIITIVESGDNWYEVAQFLGIEASGEITVCEWKKDGTFRDHKQQITHLANGKIRVETGIADWKGRAQNLKDGPHGQYITIFGKRRYID